MKNLKMTILGVTTLLFALTLNFKHALGDYGILDNKLHVEVLAQTNNTSGSSTGNSTNPWYQWPTQGITKDEREYIRPCPSSSGGSGSIGGGGGGVTGGVSGSHSQTNPSTRNEITCPYGTVNCSEVGC